MKSIELSKDDWTSLGTNLYGENQMNWKFMCPVCGNIQTIEDFRQYKDAGATPSSAYCECIGRYSGGSSAFGNNKTTKPCDYAAYGLFFVGGYIVIDGDDNKYKTFPFADDKNFEQKGI